jgi:hypothetical protein
VGQQLKPLSTNKRPISSATVQQIPLSHILCDTVTTKSAWAGEGLDCPEKLMPCCLTPGPSQELAVEGSPTPTPQPYILKGRQFYDILNKIRVTAETTDGTAKLRSLPGARPNAAIYNISALSLITKQAFTTLLCRLHSFNTSKPRPAVVFYRYRFMTNLNSFFPPHSSG